jgi:hypothetical protein
VILGIHEQLGALTLLIDHDVAMTLDRAPR